MNDNDKKMCDMIHREGTIMKDESYNIDGCVYRQFVVYYTNYDNGNMIEYHLTKRNGVWIYIHCSGIIGNIYN